jgi:hypothetical protein
MKPQIPTNTSPISIASIDSTVYRSRSVDRAPQMPAVTGLPGTPSPAQARMLAAVVSRSGEVEAAEWALDQAKAVAGEQMIAALSAGLSTEQLAEAAGVCEYAVAEIIASQAPAAS